MRLTELSIDATSGLVMRAGERPHLLSARETAAVIAALIDEVAELRAALAVHGTGVARKPPAKKRTGRAKRQ